METMLVVSSILLWIVMLLNILLTIGLARRINSLPQEVEILKRGQKAPNFSAPTLQGKPMTMADYEGRSTAFIFVSPTCQPCREELPRLQSLLPNARQLGMELVLVSDGDEEKTRTLVNGQADSFEILIAPREHNPFFTDFKVPGTPSFYLLDPQGKVQGTGFGGPALGEIVETLSRNKRR